MNYKYIYLVFSRTGTWLSRALTVLSDDKYVHASISFDNSFTKMYSFGRTNPDNPLSGGFVEENLFDGVFKKFPDSECLICRVMVTENQYYSLKKDVRKFLLEKEKYKYNFLGLFGVWLNKPVNRSYYYFCSQFVSEILIKNKIYDTNKAPSLVTPYDLLSMKNIEIIYEGFISDYYGTDELYVLDQG